MSALPFGAPFACSPSGRTNLTRGARNTTHSVCGQFHKRLEQWLSDYPDTMSYASVLQAIGLDSFCSGDFDIVLWEVIENYPNDDIIEMIEDTRKSFESSADDLMYGVALHDVMEGACDDYE